MTRKVRLDAEGLTLQFGREALARARNLLEQTTAARDHKSAIHWAEVCSFLAAGRDQIPMGGKE